jgi:hypothetical protein
VLGWVTARHALWYLEQQGKFFFFRGCSLPLWELLYVPYSQQPPEGNNTVDSQGQRRDLGEAKRLGGAGK